MKKYLLVITLLFVMANVSAQNIGISATGETPHSSAMLDVSATNKGFLMPRMTSAQRMAITGPAEGLKVYDTDTKTFWFYNGAGWIQSATGSAVNFWTLSGGNIFNNNTGNVGIGLNTPMAPLHIKNDVEALRIQGATPFLSFASNAGQLKGFLQSYNNDLYLGTPSTNTTGSIQFYTANIPAMSIQPTANVLIGADATNLFGKLSVQTLNNSYGISHLGEGGNILATRMGGTSAGIGTFSNTNMRIFANGESAIFVASGTKNVGIGVDFPANKLQVGSIGAATYSGNDLAIGNGTNAMRIYQSPDATVIASNNTNMVLWPKEANGNVGINTLNQPTNKLQIGSVGNSGFSTNDLAIGNGTAAMAIYQTNASTLIGSTTNIVLKPQNNGQGRVGINTNTPRAPLDVAYSASVNRPSNGFFGYSYLNINSGLVNGPGFSNENPVPEISIVTDGRVLSTEFDAYSDMRIKDIEGVSNSISDLQTINNVRITDYTMKDKVRYGNRRFKKVIAQEVEKVYPQVVSKHVDFIPNVYQLTSKVEKTDSGYLLSFTNKHTISSTAKKLQVMRPAGNGMEQFTITRIISDRQVLINATDIKEDKIFVYGEEVDDFRTVDYEALTTLNISATQEISKIIKKQQVMIDALERRLASLEKKKSPLQQQRLAAMHKPSNGWPLAKIN